MHHCCCALISGVCVSEAVNLLTCGLSGVTYKNPTLSTELLLLFFFLFFSDFLAFLKQETWEEREGVGAGGVGVACNSGQTNIVHRRY